MLVVSRRVWICLRIWPCRSNFRIWGLLLLGGRCRAHLQMPTKWRPGKELKHSNPECLRSLDPLLAHTLALFRITKMRSLSNTSQLPTLVSRSCGSHPQCHAIKATLWWTATWSFASRETSELRKAKRHIDHVWWPSWNHLGPQGDEGTNALWCRCTWDVKQTYHKQGRCQSVLDT